MRWTLSFPIHETDRQAEVLQVANSPKHGLPGLVLGHLPTALFNWVPMDASSGEVEALFWVSNGDMPDASADR